MRFTHLTTALCAAFTLAGCVTTEVARFQPGANQKAVVRDGRNAIVSQRKNSIVMVSPASREFNAGARPVYVLAVNNLSRGPVDFAVHDVAVHQTLNGEPGARLPVKTYEQLVQEERTRQVVGAVLVGLAAGANAAAASNAGYGTSRSTIYSGGRVATVNTTYYSPTAAAIAHSNAAAQNEAMIANTIEAGRANLASLEQTVIKDHTLLPGEWYGGQLHFEPPQSSDGKPKSYSIEVTVAGETHRVDVVQAPTS